MTSTSLLTNYSRDNTTTLILLPGSLSSYRFPARRTNYITMAPKASLLTSSYPDNIFYNRYIMIHTTIGQ
jgi:hypothetical protein